MNLDESSPPRTAKTNATIVRTMETSLTVSLIAESALLSFLTFFVLARTAQSVSIKSVINSAP